MSEGMLRHIIDLDADPFVPEGWTVEEHRKMGQFEWDPAKVRFYLPKQYRTGHEYIEGPKLREEVLERDPFNACMLDYYLAHPHLVPEEWKGRLVYFWGTIYRDQDDYLYVRYLYWGGTEWRCGCRRLDLVFFSLYCAAVRSAA